MMSTTNITPPCGGAGTVTATATQRSFNPGSSTFRCSAELRRTCPLNPFDHYADGYVSIVDAVRTELRPGSNGENGLFEMRELQSGEPQSGGLEATFNLEKSQDGKQVSFIAGNTKYTIDADLIPEDCIANGAIKFRAEFKDNQLAKVVLLTKSGADSALQLACFRPVGVAETVVDLPVDKKIDPYMKDGTLGSLAKAVAILQKEGITLTPQERSRLAKSIIDKHLELVNKRHPSSARSLGEAITKMGHQLTSKDASIIIMELITNGSLDKAKVLITQCGEQLAQGDAEAIINALINLKNQNRSYGGTSVRDVLECAIAKGGERLSSEYVTSIIVESLANVDDDLRIATEALECCATIIKSDDAKKIGDAIAAEMPKRPSLRWIHFVSSVNQDLPACLNNVNFLNLTPLKLKVDELLDPDYSSFFISDNSRGDDVYAIINGLGSNDAKLYFMRAVVTALVALPSEKFKLIQPSLLTVLQDPLYSGNQVIGEPPKIFPTAVVPEVDPEEIAKAGEMVDCEPYIIDCITKGNVDSLSFAVGALGISGDTIAPAEKAHYAYLIITILIHLKKNGVADVDSILKLALNKVGGNLNPEDAKAIIETLIDAQFVYLATVALESCGSNLVPKDANAIKNSIIDLRQPGGLPWLLYALQEFPKWGGDLDEQFTGLKPLDFKVDYLEDDALKKFFSDDRSDSSNVYKRIEDLKSNEAKLYFMRAVVTALVALPSERFKLVETSLRTALQDPLYAEDPIIKSMYDISQPMITRGN